MAQLIFPMLIATTLPSLQRVIYSNSQATCAMRLLHFVSSPMHLGMITCFHGHIRELVLCAIGNGWTWADQTATVQGRRVSIGEVCAAFASYLNLNAFPAWTGL